MKKYQLCGIGNALVDILIDVAEDEFEALALEKGTMRLVSLAEQGELLSKIDSQKSRLVSGGSVANSVILFAQLGGKAAFACCTGDDKYGNFYRDEFKKIGIHIPCPVLPGIQSGTCLALVTPDAERTMRTCLGAGEHMNVELIDSSVVADSDWLFVEGYPLANPPASAVALKHCVEVAKKAGTKVAITCSEPWVVSSFRENLDWILERTDLVFTNEEEAQALAGKGDPKSNCQEIAKRIPHVIVSCGPQGAYVSWNGKLEHVPAVPTEPRDLLGAGDALAGTFLYGITQGMAPKDALAKANYMAHLVISQVGARLTTDVKKAFASA